MKNMAIMSFMIIAILGLIAMPAFAQGPPTNPNGFPSGDHYNLNILGKNDSFACPDQEFDESGNPIYGNVVFVPEWGTGDILLRSGSGRKSTGFATLAVTDPCVTAIDDDPAEVQIPPLPDGYWVYGRALGKLVDDPENPLSMLISPGVVSVSSADEEDLVYLGYVTPNGFYAAGSGIKVDRIKGKHPAVPLDTLFYWTGDVCLATDPDPEGEDNYVLQDVCVADTNGDGIKEIVFGPEAIDTLICPEGTELVSDVYCRSYTMETATNWIFNIADFVDYFWDVTNSGTKNVQIRLYPR